MSAISKPLILSFMFTIFPGINAGYSFAQDANELKFLPTTATLSGVYTYTFPAILPGPISAPYALQQYNYDGQNLSLTTTDASLTVANNQYSTYQNAGAGGIFQTSIGMGGETGDTPSPGNSSGTVTTNLSNFSMDISFLSSGWYPPSLYGLYSVASGGMGGDSTSHHKNGGQGGTALETSLTINNGSFTIELDRDIGSGAAIAVEQYGGTGGAGYHDMSAGRGGGAQAMTVAITDTIVSTNVSNIAGIVAKQSGGDGGAAVNHDNSNGATGGSGSSLTVTLSQGSSHRGNMISTLGDNASGVFVSAKGGNGTTGGDDGVGVSVDVTPGNGGDGGNSGASINDVAVTVKSTGQLTVQTSGDGSAAIMAASQGGHGGNGGEARGSGINPSSGGSGGRGDGVEVNLGAAATITTLGATSSAILATAKGGQGGNSGVVDANTTYADGKNGGAGGITGSVTVTLASGVELNTSGESSNGITAISSGGNAGNAGDVTAGLGSGHAGDGGQGGSAGAITVTSGATITTGGDTARGILAQAQSGGGGKGGDATGTFGNVSGSAGAGGAVGKITISNTGNISTKGAYSQGILAQSLSGSGGAGGGASGSPFSDDGGRGAAGAAGGSIQLTHSGSITTMGESAQAIVVQSIGGNGGAGGTAGGMISVSGGAGGAGGAGGSVGLTLGGDAAGRLSTKGTLSHAIVAQSIGGGGGIGGNSYGAGLDSVYSIGGTAGSGGAGGAVTVDATSLNANTTGSGAIGLLAQSIGGGGGAGGAAYATSASGLLSYSVAVGGGGGNGGAPGTVDVTLSGSTITTGLGQNGNADPNSQFDATGVLAQSIGGSGGVGGGASALATSISLPYPTEDGIGGTPTLSIAYAVGGSGGNGGSADQNAVAASIELSDGTQVVTYGTGSNGAVAQSIGGGGGQSGDSSAMAAAIGYGSGYIPGNTLSNISINVGVAVGGDCTSACTGGDGGATTLTVGNSATAHSKIITYGDFSAAGVVQSIGGGGGNAGIGSANANSIGTGSTKNITMSTGSNGGTGGDGGDATATINSDGVIVTYGVSSTGLLVQSIGGGGGVASGGSFNASGLLSWSKSFFDVQATPTVSILPTMNVGRSGGTGGDGGAVVVTHAGSLTTKGKNAVGILAQSVGGGGGVGGTAGVAASAATTQTTEAEQVVTHATLGVPLPTITITPTLSLGGAGGLGGIGGTVTANMSGSILTIGDLSAGLVAQSIGGGGGMGGLAVAGGSSNSALTAFAQLSVNSTTTLGFNGGGGTGADGGDVTINLNGTTSITTGGAHSIGILAQSIGGGGGIAYDGSDAPSGSVALGLTVSTTGGAGGIGGNILLSDKSSNLDIFTIGDSAHGVALQSVGGGGGLAAVGSTSSTNDWAVNFSLGGNAGAAGDGGNITADFGQGITNIDVRGTGSAGLIAQSIGGGGGMAATSPGLNATITQFGSISETAIAGTSNGGSVSVSRPQSESSIFTYGIGGHAIIAQSVGGGGGLFSGYTSTGVAPMLTGSYTGAGSGKGSGGDVTVSTSGMVSTSAAGAFGILAQSIGGGGGLISNGSSVFAGHTGSDVNSKAGTVTVNVDGTLIAKGKNSIGVFAQSSAPGGAGTINVNVNGTVQGGTGAQGVGIVVAGGNLSNQITIGENGWVWGQSGSAIKSVGTAGQQMLNVNNQGQIYGNTWLQGGSIDGNYQHTNGTPAGASAGTLTNSGTLFALPGKRSYVDGHLIQTATGRISPHMDYSNMRSGSYVVTGDAILDGTIRPNLASAMPNIFLPALTVDGNVSGMLTALNSSLFSYTLRENSGQYDVAITDTYFDGKRFGLVKQHNEILSALEPVFASSDAELGTFFAQLDSSAGADTAILRQTLDRVAHRNLLAVFARGAADVSRVADAAMSCSKFTSSDTNSQKLLAESSCVQITAGGYSTSLKGGRGLAKVEMDTAFLQVGGQKEISPGMFLGGALAYQSDRLNSHDGVSVRGTSGQGALTLKYQTGPLLVSGAIFGSVGEYEIERSIVVPGFSATGSSSPHSYVAGLRDALHTHLVQKTCM